MTDSSLETPQTDAQTGTASRTELKARTRARILQAALDTLIAEGYAGFSMNKVAKRAGIAQPSFYVHFKSTEELFVALAEDVADRFIKPLQQSLEHVAVSLPPTELRRVVFMLFTTGFSVIQAQQPLIRMVWAERAQPNSPLGLHMRRFYEDTKQSWSDTLLRIGLVRNNESDLLRLRLFMDGVFALFETYASFWMEGRYPDVIQPANVLTDYVLHFWAGEIGRLYPGLRSQSVEVPGG